MTHIMKEIISLKSCCDIKSMVLTLFQEKIWRNKTETCKQLTPRCTFGILDVGFMEEIR